VGAAPIVIGRYAMFDEIASGGMATVYLGRFMGPAGFARTVAIKRLHPQYAKDPEFVTMLLDEARLAARIQHPNVVVTLDVVVKKDEVFLAMEYVQGESLSRLARLAQARGERVPLPIVLRIGTDMLQGLQAAHEARDERGVPLNIVHRDVSPQNVLVGVDGVARLVDFGIAKAAGRAHTTQEGQFKGKLAYMAPEQFDGAGVSRQTDLYASSVVLWELVTGRRLFAGDNQGDTVARVMKHDVTPPSQLVADVPDVLDALIMRGLSRAPSERFGTAREMCIELGECGTPASAIAVSDWVQLLAARQLDERAARIAHIESSTPSGLLNELTRTDIPKELATEMSSVSAAGAAPWRARRFRVGAVVGIGALAFAIAGVALAVRHNAGTEPVTATPPPSAATIATSSAGGAPSAIESSAPVAAPSPSATGATTPATPLAAPPPRQGAGRVPKVQPSPVSTAGAKPCTIVSYVDSAGITRFAKECK
jgi:serine/threonine-protein kinase